jgi:hypothetical protein
MLICEAGPGESSQGGENDERRVQENQTRLSNQTVLCVAVS